MTVSLYDSQSVWQSVCMSVGLHVSRSACQSVSITVSLSTAGSFNRDESGTPGVNCKLSKVYRLLGVNGNNWVPIFSLGWIGAKGGCKNEWFMWEYLRDGHTRQNVLCIFVLRWNIRNIRPISTNIQVFVLQWMGRGDLLASTFRSGVWPMEGW